MTSWTHGQINHRTSSAKARTEVALLEASFGLRRAALAAANLLFLGYATDAAGAMANSTRLELER